MPMYDFKCKACDIVEEDLTPAGTKHIECPKCGCDMDLMPVMPSKMPTHIILDYPGSKKNKAGYVHSHGDRDATKIQSGYGGCQGPKPGVNKD